MNDFPRAGIKLSYILNEFLDNVAGGAEKLKGWTTAEVCQDIIKTKTNETKSSYCDLLKQQDHEAYGETAQVFISHAHCYDFLHLLSALRWHFQKDHDNNNYNNNNNERKRIKGNDPFVWIDLFSINQHVTTDWTFEWLSMTFKSSIQLMGRTVMVMSPWNNPIPFKRTWCVFEAYCTLVTNSKFEIAMSKRDEATFLQDVKNDPEGRIDELLSCICANKSQCSVESDRENIFSVIQATVGFSNLDAMVFHKYREWVVQVAQEDLDIKLKEASRLMNSVGILYMSQGKYSDAEKYFKDSMNTRRKSTNNNNNNNVDDKDDDNSPEMLRTMNSLGLALDRQGKYNEAEAIYRACFERRTATLGENHLYTLHSMHNLATALYNQGNYDQAEKLFHSCLQQRESVLGENHLDTMDAMGDLSALFTTNTITITTVRTEHDKCKSKDDGDGENNKNKYYYQKGIFPRRMTILGEAQPDSQSSIMGLAAIYSETNRWDDVQFLFQSTFEHKRNLLSAGTDGGDQTIETVRSLNILASMLSFREKKCSQTEILYRLCFERVKALLGEDHAATLRSMKGLAYIFLVQQRQQQQRYDNAQSLYRACLERQRGVLGESHPDTLRSMNDLAFALVCKGKYDEAMSLYNDCIKQLQTVLGTDHPETLRATMELGALMSRMGQGEEAAHSTLEYCFERQSSILGENHPDTLLTMRWITENINRSKPN